MFVSKRMGGSCTQVGKPGIQETGRPEGLPRTAAITDGLQVLNSPAITMEC
jgi:hypothetical protein